MEIARELARFCAELKFNDLPDEVVDRGCYFALDYIGVAARGSAEESTKTMYRFLGDLCTDRKGGVVVGTKSRIPHHLAALANGTSAHSLEMDDVNNEASLHPAVAVFPAAFAAAERGKKNGRKLIEGAVLGYDIMIRMGKALRPREHYERGFHPTATCGVFGAAAAAGKILGLTENQFVNAFGIAGSMAAGSLEFLADGAWTKRMHPGWAAQGGIYAALLARRGFIGPSTIIEGKSGFLRAYTSRPAPEKLLEDIGKTFGITRTSIKPHSCCRYMQPPIDGVLAIMRENGLKSTDIEKVTIGILKAGIPIVASPPEQKRHPKTVVDAQFSMPFGAAVAILYGKATLDEFRQPLVESTEVRSMMKRIVCVEDARLDKVYPKQWPASVSILTKGGKTCTTWIDYPKGDPENALSWEELAAKFRSLTGRIYTKKRASRIVDAVRRAGEIADVSVWTPLLQKDR